MGIKIKINGTWVSAETLIKIDDTLTEPGQSADAFATGQKIRGMEDKFNELKGQVPTVPKVMQEVDDKLAEYNFVNKGKPEGAWAIKNGGTGATTADEALRNLQGISFTELWRYPLDNYDDRTKENGLFGKEDETYNVTGIGDSKNYPYLIIAGQKSSLILANRTTTAYLTYSYWDEASFAMFTGSRIVKINAETGQVTFGQNRVSGVSENATSGHIKPLWPSSYGSNTDNKPWAIIGVSNVTNLEGEINKLANRAY